MPATQKIIITCDIGEKALSILEQERADLSLHLQIWSEPRRVDREWLLHHAHGASGLLITVGEKVDDELLNAAGPSLKVISTMSVGHEHVSLPALAKRNIKLGYTPDVLTDAVADVCIMLALMVSRNVGQVLDITQTGQWPQHPWTPFGFCGPQLSAPSVPSSAAAPAKIAGFLGFGRIARATVHRLAAFGVTHILYADSTSQSIADSPQPTSTPPAEAPARVSVATLAASSDILFILAPHTPATHHVVNAVFLRLMKPTAVLVNAARGGLVDSDALAEALNESRIWGAGLDVVEGEPNVTVEHPLIKEPRCIVLPHIGSATIETRVGMACLAARNLLRGLLGEPLESGVELGPSKERPKPSANL